MHVSELPLQKGSSRTKAAPGRDISINLLEEYLANPPIDFNSKPNSWSEFSPNKTVKKGGQDSQLPHQSVSQSSGKKAAPGKDISTNWLVEDSASLSIDLVTELNSCSKIGPNKTIKKEVHVSQLPIQSNSHRFRKKIAPGKDISKNLLKKSRRVNQTISLQR